MLSERTSEIIMICKGNHNFGEFKTFKEAIAAYMSDRCGCPIEVYTEELINDIIWTAAIDLQNNMRRAGFFLWETRQVMNLHNNPFVKNINRVDIYEAMCGAFQLISVRDDNGFINGFTEENTGYVHKTEQSH